MIRHSVEKLAWASPVASWRGKVSHEEQEEQEEYATSLWVS